MSNKPMELSPYAYPKCLKQILTHVGVRHGVGCTIPAYFPCFIKRLRVIAMEVKIDDPRLEDEYELSAALKIASENLKKGRYFVLGGKLDGWAEISKHEFTALSILEEIGDKKITTIEYEPELLQITLKGDNGFRFTNTNDADTIDDFLKIIEAMDDIRSGDFYARIKEAKHE